MSGQYNWDEKPHQRLYDDIHGRGGFFRPDGAGVSGASGSQEGWAALADLMARAHERTETALAKAGAVWDGGAADAMRSGVTPLAQWAADANTASSASQSSTELHIDAYSSAKNAMPEPVEVTSTANGGGGIPTSFVDILAGQADQDRQEAAAQEAKAEAVRTMLGYEFASAVSQGTVGKFVPPPAVAVDVPAPPKSGIGDSIPVGDREPPGPRHPVDGGTGSPDDTAGNRSGPGATPPPGAGSGPGSATTPSVVTPTPTPSTAAPPAHLPVTGSGSDQYRSGITPFPGGTGRRLGERGPGSTGRGPGGSGHGPGSGGAGRGPGGAGPGEGLRGGMRGGPISEPVAGRGTTPGTAGGRGVGGMGMGGPMGGRSEGDEDKEHQTAEYLRGTHDSFWDDTPPVAPSVIGDDEEDY
ncbi:PPE domain-containing protein [Actinophytocola glycyrrhizae]|uniref:PPE domain-containing protein n=1 Tax=Actinophytocola glycyrrhizae TaxID=2044873 RepID=A0ABV9S7B2_9PSEU